KGDARVSADGRVEVDLATREPGRTTVGIRHQGGSEIAWCTVTVIADTGRLQAQVDAANTLDSTAYTSASWKPLLPALEAGKDVLAAPGSAQGQVDAAADALAAALAGLIRLDAAPSAPRDVVATASGDRVNVQWTVPENVGGSPIIAYEVAVGDRVVQAEGAVLTAAVTGLAAGEYAVTVRAQNAGGWSVPSAAIVVVVDPEVVTPSVTVEGSPKVGGRIDVSGVGFQPGIEYTVQLRSTPADLGTVTAETDGSFAFRGVVPEDVEAGAHTLVVMHDGADIASTPVRIIAAAGPGAPGGPGDGGTDGSGALPATGGDLAWLPWTLAMALLLLLSGAVAMKARRQPRD
ncbi:fibronectin type III domain-containing protein, partial [Microbacterium sp. AGC62]